MVVSNRNLVTTTTLGANNALDASESVDRIVDSLIDMLGDGYAAGPAPALFMPGASSGSGFGRAPTMGIGGLWAGLPKDAQLAFLDGVRAFGTTSDGEVLSVEERVMRLLEAIMMKMDDEILSAAEEIEALQDGRAEGSGGKTSGDSVDVKVARLARMNDKRNQMFEMLRQIGDKYADTARSALQSLA